MRRRRGATALLVLAAVVASTRAHAQTRTGTIAGRVSDTSGLGIPSATIALVGSRGTVRAVSDAGGEYRFAGVDPGVNALRFELSGFRPHRRDGIALRAGDRLTVDVLLAVGGVSDDLEAVADDPLIDVRASSFRFELPQEILFDVPLARVQADGFGTGLGQLMNATPGVNQNSAHGASPANNALLVDGVDTRDPADGGFYVGLNYNALQEVVLVGPGAPAEYGAFTGAMVDTVTRSGGNRFSGLAEIRHTTGGLAADNVDAELEALNPGLEPIALKGLVDATAMLAGPVVRERLFFMANVQHYDGRSDPVGGVSERTTRSDRAVGRLDARPWNAGALSALVNLDRTRLGRWIGGSDELASDYDVSTTTWNLQGRHLFGDSTLADVRYLGWEAVNDTTPSVGLVPSHVDLLSGEVSGSAGYIGRNETHRHQLNASITHHATAWGRHELKFGLEVERGRARGTDGRVGGTVYLDLGAVPYQAYSYSGIGEAKTDRTAVYVQDAWQPTPRLTLNLGARLDALRGGAGAQVLYATDALAPRVGAALDLSGDGRSVVRGSVGRYHEMLPYRSFGPALPYKLEHVFYDNTGSGLVEIGRLPPPAPATVDPDLRHPRMDEVSVGFERVLGHDVRVSVCGLVRWYGNMLDVMHPDARFSALTVTNPLTDDPMTVYPWVDPSVREQPGFITNVDGFRYLDADDGLLGTADARRTQRSLMLVVSRRLRGRWHAQASYVLGSTRGTANNTWDAALSAQGFDAATEALVNAEGSMVHDFRHELKLLGSYLVPRVEVGISGYLRIVSGLTGTPSQFMPLAGLGDTLVRLAPRGSVRVPTQATLDARLTKGIRLPRGSLDLYVDVTNVLNADTPTFYQFRYPSRADGLPYGAPLGIVPPRQATLGARWVF